MFAVKAQGQQDRIVPSRSMAEKVREVIARMTGVMARIEPLQDGRSPEYIRKEHLEYDDIHRNWF